jgi:hypothetical protein
MSKPEEALKLLRRERDDELKRVAAARLDEEYAQAQMVYGEFHDHSGKDLQAVLEQAEKSVGQRKAAEERAEQLSASIEKLESSAE